MHIILPFLVLITGMLVTGYVSLFSSSKAGRSSAVVLLVGAALLVGGMLSANFNGGKPYGLDVSFGLPRWKTDAKVPPQNYPQRPSAANEEKLKVPEDSGSAVA